MSVRRTTAGLVLAPVLLVLSACGGGDDSVADPPVSSPPTSSPTASPGHERPEHFIRRWAEEDVRMQQSGKSSDFRALAHGCSGCNALADRVDSIYAAGGFIRTKGWEIKSVQVVSRDSDRCQVDLRVSAYPTTYRERADGPEKTLLGGPATYQLGLTKAKDAWVVTSLARLAS